jgi:hypothetical protein
VEPGYFEAHFFTMKATKITKGQKIKAEIFYFVIFVAFVVYTRIASALGGRRPIRVNP